MSNPDINNSDLTFKCPVCGGSEFSSRISKLMHGPLGGWDPAPLELIGFCHGSRDIKLNGGTGGWGKESCIFGWSRPRNDHKYFT